VNVILRCNDTGVHLPTQIASFTYGIGIVTEALPIHIQRLMGDIPDYQEPPGGDCTGPKDTIVVTGGSVLFGVGYHSWLIAMENEDILLAGGGAGEGPQILLTSYISELGGLAAGIGALGTLARSGNLTIRSLKFIFDNYATILASRRGLTTSVYHRTEI
jgi:hypothetical protein